jgi:hypothetical protein
MGKGQKEKFAKALVAKSADFNDYIKTAKKEDDTPDEKPPPDVTVLPSIAVLNSCAGSAPPLPVKIDGHLAHIGLRAGGLNGGPITVLVALADTGAGATIGSLPFFEAAVLINPDILVQIFTCLNGEYTPITMHGVVDTAVGATSTDLPVAFQIRTDYKCRDGSELHLLVALGKDVSVNFILGNAWMKGMGAIMDYGSNELRVPLHDDIHKFPLIFRSPMKNVPSLDKRSTHERAFTCLPKITSLVTCISKYNPTSQWLGTARGFLHALQASLAPNPFRGIGLPGSHPGNMHQVAGSAAILRAAGTAARVHECEVHTGGDFGATTVQSYLDGSGKKTVAFKLNVPSLETTGHDAIGLASTCARDDESSTEGDYFSQQL